MTNDENDCKGGLKQRGGFQPRVVTGAHRRFLLLQVASFVTRPVDLRNLLRSKRVASENGFDAISLTNERVRQLVTEIDEKELTIARLQYLADFTDCPLAYKKRRVLELVDMYQKIPDYKTLTAAGVEVKLSDVQQVQMRMSILAQIREEIGEDMDKLALALSKVSHTTVVNNVQIGSAELDKRPNGEGDHVRRNVQLVLERYRQRFAASSDN